MPSYSSERRYPRIAAQHPVLLTRLDDANIGSLSKTVVVGGGGCLVIHEEPFGKGTHLKLLLSLQGRVLQVVGRVVYETPREDGRIDVGIEFVEMNPEDRPALDALFEKC